MCRRWLAAPLQLPDGTLQERDRGTPQGSAVSPVLANLFLHYAFDAWMAREFPAVRFERYADDAVVHCVSERQAEQRAGRRSRTGWSRSGCGCIPTRPGSCTARTATARSLRAHVVHVPGVTPSGPRGADKHGRSCSPSFLPAISRDALKRSSRRSAAGGCTGAPVTTSPISPGWINPIVRGWMQYYGAFYRSALYPLLTHQHLPDAVDPQEIRAVARVQARPRRGGGHRSHRYPRLFAHWAWTRDFLATRMTRAV